MLCVRDFEVLMDSLAPPDQAEAAAALLALTADGPTEHVHEHE